MFESEEKKRERAEAKARTEAWRVDDAGNHEQEKIDIEKVDREQSILHKIDAIDGVVTDYENKKDTARVEKAKKREAKAIEKENRRAKNRKYWIIAVVIIALAAGAVGGFLLNGLMNHRAQYEQGTKLILDENYSGASVVLENLKYKDSEKLFTYVDLRSNANDYKGKMNKLYNKLTKIEGLSNSQINAQYNEFVGQVQDVAKLQKKLNKIDVDEITLDDKSDINALKSEVKSLGGEDSGYLDKSKLNSAKKKIEKLEKKKAEAAAKAAAAKKAAEEAKKEAQETQSTQSTTQSNQSSSSN